MTAAVVKVGGAGGEEARFDSEAHGFGYGDAGDRRFVALDLGFWG